MRKIIILCFVMILFLYNCKEKNESTQIPEKSQSLQSVILIAVGDVTAAGKKVKAGDIVQENEVIKVGKKSFADIQILNQEITFRAKEQTEINLKNIIKSGKTEIAGNVSVGSIMVNAQKLKQNEGLNVVTPTVVMAVRGTKFEATVATDGKTQTTVLEGKVAARVNIPELEALSDSDIKKSQSVTKLNEFIQSKELVLEAGQSTTCEANYPKTIVKDLGLDSSIKTLNANNIAEVDQKVNPEEVNKKVSAQKELLKPNAVASSEISKKLKDYDELVSLELSKQSTELRNNAITERNKNNNELILKRISEVVGKEPETLVLKNGEKIRGVILNEGEKIYILTATGKREYSTAEVESVEF